MQRMIFAGHLNISCIKWQSHIDLTLLYFANIHGCNTFTKRKKSRFNSNFSVQLTEAVFSPRWRTNRACILRHLSTEHMSQTREKISSPSFTAVIIMLFHCTQQQSYVYTHEHTGRYLTDMHLDWNHKHHYVRWWIIHFRST